MLFTGQKQSTADQTLNVASSDTVVLDEEREARFEEKVNSDYGHHFGDLGREIQYSMQMLREKIHEEMQGHGLSKENPATSCQDIFLHSATRKKSGQIPLEDGLYWIDPNEGCPADSFQAHCKFMTSPMTCVPADAFQNQLEHVNRANAPNMDAYFLSIMARGEGRNAGQRSITQRDFDQFRRLKHLARSHRTFLHLRSSVAEQTIKITCREFDLWQNENDTESGYEPQNIQFKSWDGKRLLPRLASLDVPDSGGEIISPRVKRGKILITIVEDNCGTRNTSWQGAVLRIISFVAEQLPVTQITWPKPLDPNQVFIDIGTVCFR